MAQLPIKFRTLQIIDQHEGITNEDILEILKKEYPRDRVVNYDGVEKYLISLKAVGLIEAISVTLTNSGKLKQSYKITPYGISRMKYVG